MKFAFCLFNYFPFGGLQRDFLRLAKEAIRRGHSVTVYTMAWQGEREPGLTIKVLPTKGWQNHTRCRYFVEQLKAELAKRDDDLIVGFNKMPGLDAYYAADTCYQAKVMTARSCWYRLLPRYKQWRDFETSVFDERAATNILLIAPQQQALFQQYYQTAAERFHLLPPGIAKDRMAPLNAKIIRQRVRSEWAIANDEFLLLSVGSGFKTKGLDRSIKALAALPQPLRNRCRLFVIGDDQAASFKRQASKLGVAACIQFLGGRHDVASFLLAADILLHPAYNENTGTVLLEALAAGLPVMTTDVCGYAPYVEQAKAGNILPSPFQQLELNERLAVMLLSPERELLRENAIAFSKTADIYSMPERAMTILESLG